MTKTRGEYAFVELNRTFYELPEGAGGSDNIDIHRVLGKHLGWPDLIQCFRVIFLSEAGTGKTAELRHIAETMRIEGKDSFFLRLEHVSQDFEDAFEVGSFEEFNAWLASNNEGWLLLDSVDEARLRDPRDFELAIRKLGRLIVPAQQRVHIIITSRTIAWRPKTDLDHCATHLPYKPPTVTAEVDDQLNGDYSETGLKTKARPKGKLQSVFTIVSIEELDHHQIETFAAAKGVKDTQAFLNALERADARSFAARPQDLQELVEFWNDVGQIGGQLEIMENSINRRLSERDQGRADARSLSASRIREGARLVASAATLVQDPTVRVPDGADNSKGIYLTDILPDWDDRERAILLSRPIFDEAIYGTVRFHHRSVREYLTAEWLAELLKRETSRRKIEALLFRNQYGVDVVVPTMRPILPWLAILDDKVRQRIGQIAPEVLLEGGDPSRLPRETRKRLLVDVCDRIAAGASSGNAAGNASVQRFANEDIVGDVKELIKKYAENDDIAFFLLRMVWIGELKDALPEAKAFAVSTTSSRYTRIAAFRAVQAIGTVEDMEELRTRFLGESAELNRECLAELLANLDATTRTIRWLFDCLAKAKTKESYGTDELTDAVKAFVEIANIELLPDIIFGLNSLLDTPPLLERRNCDISQKFSWLTGVAERAIGRLIEARHSASLRSDSLALLHKLGVARRNGVDNRHEKDSLISTLVPAWPELNRACFWYDTGKARERLKDENGETLTEFWQVGDCGSSFWKFVKSDFDYAVEQIAERTLPDERRLALSLAFRLYVIGDRDRRQRESLKKVVANDILLAGCLKTYLKPPAQGRQSWKRSEATWKRRSEAMKLKESKNREDGRRFFRANADTLRNNGLDRGEMSHNQWYLHELTREENDRSGRWSSGDWKCLVKEFSEEVARAYRDGVTQFWREYLPELRSEGAPANTTPCAVIFGLTGLEIEAMETTDWPKALSMKEVELACRYAFHELNGFPNWFPTLFAAYPSIVGQFILQEIRYELSIEKVGVESYYILSDISWSGQWAWDDLAPDIYAILDAGEPENVSNLDHLLNIVQGSSITDSTIAKLASKRCNSLTRPDHVARWFATWVGVDPESAIPCLAKHLDEMASPEERAPFAMQFITNVLGSRHSGSSRVRTGFRTPEYLKRLYLLMHQHIRAAEDIRRKPGAYTPGLRDDAQSARETLAELLRNHSGKDAFIALMEIAGLHPEEAYRHWFARLAKAKAETDADITAWSPHQVREFYDQLERTPANHRELAELAHLRLLDLKDDIEEGDTSIASLLQGVDHEPEIRKFIGRELREKALGRYNIPQEEELADAKRPDLRFLGTGFDGPVPVELKLAENWTGPQLLERMENQLCGDYLRDNHSNRGFFVLVYRGKRKGWKVPGIVKKVNFIGLIAALEKHWRKIALSYPRVEHIEVIGIDLTKRSR